MKVLKTVGLFLLIWSLFWVGVVVGIVAEEPTYLPIPDQEVHGEAVIGGWPVVISGYLDGDSQTLTITVTPGYIPGSFTVQEEQ